MKQDIFLPEKSSSDNPQLIHNLHTELVVFKVQKPPSFLVYDYQQK